VHARLCRVGVCGSDGKVRRRGQVCGGVCTTSKEGLKLKEEEKTGVWDQKEEDGCRKRDAQGRELGGSQGCLSPGLESLCCGSGNFICH
jgi:hypothetical protein